MPRPLLNKTQQNTQQSSHLNAKSDQKNAPVQNKQLDKMMRDRLLRKKRSKAYMDAVAKLDAGGHVHNQEKVKEIIGVIKSELPEIELPKETEAVGNDVFLGYVSICHLGRPYEVHTLDLVGGIIEHYETGHQLPNGMEKARGMAMRGGYAFIEVYTNCCRAVGFDGTVSVIAG